MKLIDEFDLPREAIPTQWLNEAVVWEALLERMPMTAMIRNLGKMTSLGLLAPFSDAKRLIVRKLRDETALKRARIHPLAVLVAQKIYAQGHGDKGALKWSPVSAVVDALDEAFYATFQNVEPCGKPVLLALDVSGSMAASMIAGSCISAREGERGDGADHCRNRTGMRNHRILGSGTRRLRRHAWRWRTGHHPREPLAAHASG